MGEKTVNQQFISHNYGTSTNTIKIHSMWMLRNNIKILITKVQASKISYAFYNSSEKFIEEKEDNIENLNNAVQIDIVNEIWFNIEQESFFTVVDSKDTIQLLINNEKNEKHTMDKYILLSPKYWPFGVIKPALEIAKGQLWKKTTTKENIIICITEVFYDDMKKEHYVRYTNSSRNIYVTSVNNFKSTFQLMTCN